jgi:hypothetical protein
MDKPGTNWSPSEAAGVNEFLKTPLGEKWLNILYARKPRISLTNTEAAALTGALAQGYEMVFAEIYNSRTVAKESENVGARSIDTTRD